MKPQVSICMPTYNNEEFIVEAIESCLAQTFQDFELCISDDSSTDNTAQIVQDYVRKYPGKIKFDQLMQNMGVYSIAHNVNNALDMCTGEYIAFLEGDDAMLPTRIEEQVNILLNSPEAVATHHDLIIFDNNGKKEIQKKLCICDYEVNQKNLILHDNFVFTPTLMYRNINVRHDPAIKKMLDWCWMINLASHGDFIRQSKKLTKYRIHDNSITSKSFDDDILKILSLIEDKYPSVIKYVNTKRTMIYLRRLKNVGLSYVSAVMSMGIYNIMRAIFYIIKHKFLLSR